MYGVEARMWCVMLKGTSLNYFLLRSSHMAVSELAASRILSANACFFSSFSLLILSASRRKAGVRR